MLENNRILWAEPEEGFSYTTRNLWHNCFVQFIMTMSNNGKHSDFFIHSHFVLETCVGYRADLGFFWWWVVLWSWSWNMELCVTDPRQFGFDLLAAFLLINTVICESLKVCLQEPSILFDIIESTCMVAQCHCGNSEGADEGTLLGPSHFKEEEKEEERSQGLGWLCWQPKNIAFTALVWIVLS